MTLRDRSVVKCCTRYVPLARWLCLAVRLLTEACVTGLSRFECVIYRDQCHRDPLSATYSIALFSAADTIVSYNVRKPMMGGNTCDWFCDGVAFIHDASEFHS